MVSKAIKKLQPEEVLVLGIDPSLNGTGFVLMKNFEVQDYYFFTNVVSVQKKFPDHALLNREIGPSRLNEIHMHLHWMLTEFNVNYAAVEDYAYGAKSNSTFQIGGCGEMIRLILWQRGVQYRDYEISKIKKFATKSGTAEKSQMVLEAFKHGFDVGRFGKSGEDLADAFWIARMLSTELFLRNDLNYSLPAHQKAVFTEATKAYPKPIIDRPFTRR